MTDGAADLERYWNRRDIGCINEVSTQEARARTMPRKDTRRPKNAIMPDSIPDTPGNTLVIPPPDYAGILGSSLLKPDEREDLNLV